MKNIENTSTTFTCNKYNKFLSSSKCEKGCEYTHTKIGNKELNIYGGIYNITNNEEFLSIYYKNIIENNSDEFLTEKQLLNDGPLLVDIDLKYNIFIIFF